MPVLLAPPPTSITTGLDALMRRRRGDAERTTKRITALLARLGDPHHRFESVHVVGTDGKTSVTRIVGSLLHALGVRVGETTSPHLVDVAERIRLDGRIIDEAALTRHLTPVLAAIPGVEKDLDARITFFEAVTALAFTAFADNVVDVAVVEAGIGGTGDATSVIEAATAVVTPVGLDHHELGDTLTKVAREKAGVVVSSGVLISAAQPPEAAEQIEAVVAERGARLLRAGVDFGVDTRRSTPFGQQVALRGLDGSGVRGWLPLHGAHQAANAAVALATVQAHLGTTDLDPDGLRAGLASVRVPGRLEIVRRLGRPTLVLDGAHDRIAATALARSVAEIRGGRTVRLVLGMSGDRDPSELLGPLDDLVEDIIVTAPNTPTAIAPSELAMMLGDDRVQIATDPADALERAEHDADGMVVVTGSMHLAGDVRALCGVT